ncbi:hypothetical protein R3P38DRAFT_2780385 [Favolaschia claudopus]|uniref:Uncharacterized protein n=1 Tax=Favolaschia claudopus TaxID=2862362 RepID=A0AAW0B843_9AGAR
MQTPRQPKINEKLLSPYTSRSPQRYSQTTFWLMRNVDWRATNTVVKHFSRVKLDCKLVNPPAALSSFAHENLGEKPLPKNSQPSKTGRSPPTAALGEMKNNFRVVRIPVYDKPGGKLIPPSRYVSDLKAQSSK